MAKGYVLEEIAKLIGCSVEGDPSINITGVDELSSAQESDISFLANPKYYKKMMTTRAGAICIGPNVSRIEGQTYLVSESPSQAFQKALHLFVAGVSKSGFSGIHPTATIHQTAKVGKNVSIGPYCIVDQGVTIGDNTVLHPQVSIYAGVTIGQNCEIHSQVVVREDSHIGNRVILQPGCVIGGCGYGYMTDETGRHHKVPQMGNCVLEDEVEVGSNATIDRGRFKATRIKRGTKIDNLVMIGHNVEVGECSLIIAQTGISGSTKIGKHVILAGQTGIAGHIEIGDEVKVVGQSGIYKSIKEPGAYMGSPAKPVKEYLRLETNHKKSSTYIQKIEYLERKVAELEEKASC